MSSSPAAKLNFLAICSLVFRWMLCKHSLPSSASRFSPLLPFRTINSVEWLSNLDFLIRCDQVWNECTYGLSLRLSPMATASGWTHRSPSRSHGRQKPNLQYAWNTQKYKRTIFFFIGPRSPGPIYVSGLCNWVSHLRLWNFTDLTPADEDTNCILTDNDKTLPEAQRTQALLL